MAGAKKKRNLMKRHMKKGRLSKTPPPESAAHKASVDLVVKPAFARLNSHEALMELAMREEPTPKAVNKEQTVDASAPTDQASPAEEPTNQAPSSQVETADDGNVTSSGKKRRVRVRWTEMEEAFLREGVQTCGDGNWKKILIAGRQVFLACRTNVDLKDKWRVMTKQSGSSPKEEPRPKKKRRATTTPTPTPRATPQRVSPRANKYTGSYADDEDSALSADGEEIAKEPKVVELQIGTDDSYPSMMAFPVDVRKFNTIAKFRHQLSKKLKSSFREIVAIQTRRLPTDEESIESIMETDGDSFYAVQEGADDE